MAEIIRKTICYLSVVLAFLLPLFFTTVTNSVFEFNKQVLLIGAAALLFLLWTIRMVLEKKVSFTTSPLDLPLLAILIAFILSTIFSENRYFSILGFYGTFHWNLPEIIALFLLFYTIASNLKTQKEINLVMYGYLASTVLLAVLGILQYVGGLGELLGRFGGADFTPAGSFITQSVLLLVGLVLLGWKVTKALIREGIREGPALTRAGPLWAPLWTGSLFIILALVVLGGLIVTSPVTAPLVSQWGQVPLQPQKLPLTFSWDVVIGTFRNHPLFGSGLSTFLTDFTRYKPIEYNQTDIWNLRFSQAGNEYLHLLAVTGLLGLLAWVFLGWKVAKALIREGPASIKAGPLWAGSLILLSYLFIPSSTLTSFALILLLALWAAGREGESVVLSISAIREGIRRIIGHSRTDRLQPVTREDNSINAVSSGKIATELLPYLFLALGVVFAIIAGYSIYRVYAADVAFRQSLEATWQNLGVQAYDAQRRAVSLNPYQEQYHRSYALTNLALANALAGGQELADVDRQNIQLLIQQAIREARIITEVLGPTNAANWQIRGQIYAALINVAQDAQDWAIGAYQQAVLLDPYNPDIRIALGGVYFGQEQYDQATTIFSNAVLLKPDHANAHFNLAAALEMQDKKDQAIAELQTVLRLVEPDSVDYTTAESKLKELKGKEGD